MATPRISRESSLHMRKYCGSANLLRAARVVTRHYDRELRDAAGITATQLPLLAAINAGANASIRSLADDLDLERSTVSRELAGLKRLGLITTSAGTDKRATVLALTPRGHKTLSAAYDAWQRAHAAITDEYGDEALESYLAETRQFARTVKSLAQRDK